MIAFFFTMPIRSRMPISAMTVRSVRTASRAMSAATPAEGTVAGRGGPVPADRAERHHAALGGREIDFLEALGALPEARLDFHHHVILVERAVHDRNLALAESVVERVVDELRGDAEARGGGPVDHQRRLLPLILLVAAQIDELRQRAEALRDPRPPRVELPDVVPLERVPVLRVPHPAARADVLRRLV